MLEEYLSEKHKKRKKKRRRWLFVVVIVIVTVTVTALFWIIFRSPIFRVEQVVVQGNDAVASGDIVSLADSSILQGHHFMISLLGVGNMLVWPSALASSDVASIPQLSSVSIGKNYWSHTVTITVKERQPFAIWCDMPKMDANGNPEGDELCYWFDDTGTTFESAFDTQGNAILAVHDYSDQNAALGQEILPDFFVSNLISILNVLKASDLNIEEIALNDLSLEEIDVTTYNGPSIYFSLRFPAGVDLPVLQNLMTQPGFDKLQYVDFRVQNRAYYK